MIPETRIETCCNCREPTGRAGRADDSIFVCEGEIGPLCEPCYVRLREEMIEDSEIRSALSEAQKENERLRAALEGAKRE